MPCYSKILTVLIDLVALEAAAKNLGITVTKRTANSYTLKRGSDQITIERTREGEKFSTVAYTGTGGYVEQIIQPLTQAYAKERVKQFARKSGYTVSAGTQPGTYVLTKYS